ncbi:MAG: tetratricopeptide repeat protein, partial [Bacteroidota bacterium]
TLLPSLRRSELIVNGQNPLKSDDELKTYMSSLDKLNDIELLHLGSILTDLNQKLPVYTQLVAAFPNDWRGYNDLGAVQFLLGNKTEGAANISKANSLSPETGVILLNLANVARMNGDFKGAEELYKKASDKGADPSYGLAIMAIKLGNYTEAVNQFNKSGKKDFNFALAQLLNGDAAAAQSTIDNMKPEELTWNCYYLRAIIGARTNNQDMMSTNITRAVQLNAEVRTMAKDDVEFIKFWSNPVFQSAIR